MALLYHNNNSISNVTSFAQVPAGDMKLLSTATASSSANINFNNTFINSSYKIYKFDFINIHPQTDAVTFEFNLSTDNGSNYNVVKTSTYFRPYHDEADTLTGLSYNGGLAQSTAFQLLSSPGDVNADSDQGLQGSLTLYNPSSSTFVKHFICVNNYTAQTDFNINAFIAGYGNTTNPINAIRFQMSSGNIDAGQIKLYGIGAN